MAGGYHLWEINQNGLLIFIYHDVELVEIAVDHAVIGQLQQQIHQFFKQCTCILQLSQLTSSERNEIYNNVLQINSTSIEKKSITGDSRSPAP